MKNGDHFWGCCCELPAGGELDGCVCGDRDQVDGAHVVGIFIDGVHVFGILPFGIQMFGNLVGPLQPGDVFGGGVVLGGVGGGEAGG